MSRFKRFVWVLGVVALALWLPLADQVNRAAGDAGAASGGVSPSDLPAIDGPGERADRAPVDVTREADHVEGGRRTRSTSEISWLYLLPVWSRSMGTGRRRRGWCGSAVTARS